MSSKFGTPWQVDTKRCFIRQAALALFCRPMLLCRIWDCVLCFFFFAKPLIGTVQVDPMVQSTLVLYILFMISVHFPTSLWLNVSSWFCTCGLSFSSYLTSRWAKILDQPNGSLPASCQVRWRFVVPQNTVEVNNYLVWRYVSLPETNIQFIAENGWKLEDDPAKATGFRLWALNWPIFTCDACYFLDAYLVQLMVQKSC